MTAGPIRRLLPTARSAAVPAAGSRRRWHGTFLTLAAANALMLAVSIFFVAPMGQWSHPNATQLRLERLELWIALVFVFSIVTLYYGHLLGVKLERDFRRRVQTQEALLAAREELELRVQARTQELGNANDFLKNEIAERERVEHQLRFSEERYRELWEKSQGFICTHDLTGNLLSVNPAGAAALGWTPEEMIDRNLGEFLTGESRERIALYLEAARRSEIIEGEMSVRTRAGETRVWQYRNCRRSEDGCLPYIVGHAQDITAHKAMQRELRAAKHAAEEANRAKSEFLAHMSHEIRTPMNGVLGMIELALGTENAEERREHLETAKYSADLLLAVINDILDFSKIEAGELRLEQVEFELTPLIERLTRSFAAAAAAKGLALSAAIAPELPASAVGDPLRLRQVLGNLLSNALKFTAQGGITLGATRDTLMPVARGLGILFSVSDTGVGIAPDKHAQIFDAFRQADSSTTREYGGTGLGLSICKKLVEKMGGRIWLESGAEAGATFYFTAHFAEAAQPPPNNLQPKEPSRAPLIRTGRALRVLVAEDNAVNRKLALALLRKAGCEATPANDGHEAVAVWRDGNFDLILMDLEMPNMDGIAATAAIRAEEGAKGPHTAIIAMTAHNLRGDRERCFAAGMDGYISKPIQSAKLMEEILRHITAGGAPPREHKSFDEQELLARVSGDRALLAELIEVFCESAGGLLTKLRENIAQKDSEGARLAAHALKGAISNFAAVRAHDLAAQVEAQSERSELKLLPAQMDELAEQVATLQQQLRAFIAGKQQKSGNVGLDPNQEEFSRPQQHAGW